MIRVTRLTDYGVGLMAHLAVSGPGNQATAPGLSREMQLPLPTVRKILKILTREKLLVSRRGAAGGYSLARRPAEITLMDMVAALEGPLELTECAGSKACGCERLEICGLRDNWNWVNNLLQDVLRSCTLDRISSSLPTIRTYEDRTLQTLTGPGNRGQE